MLYRMVFDVEAVGLHGEAWQVGVVVMDDNWNVVQEVEWTANRALARGTEGGHSWCRQFCDPASADTGLTPFDLRENFFRLWMSYAEDVDNCQLWADCAWPVESRFLAAMIDDDHARREWSGPYPLHEICTLILAKCGDCLIPLPRTPQEKPPHKALSDARQSARILKHLMTGGKYEELLSLEEGG